MNKEERFINFIKIFLILLLLVLFFVLLNYSFDDKKYQDIQIKGRLIKVELAESEQAHYQGLSGRDGLCGDCGMLFVFNERQEQTFVMRDMKFPLDILFITNGEIVNLVESANPEGSDYSTYYSSQQAVDYVLELPGGYSKKYDIKIGDRVYGLNFR